MTASCHVASDGCQGWVHVVAVMRAAGDGCHVWVQVVAVLLAAINDRCLLRDERFPEDRFYPRVEVWTTDSFAELGPDWQVYLAHFALRHVTTFPCNQSLVSNQSIVPLVFN